jgi:hypothetical protein
VPNRPAAALPLRAGDREELVRLPRSSLVRAGLAQQARIVLLASDGLTNTAIAELVGDHRLERPRPPVHLDQTTEQVLKKANRRAPQPRGTREH